MEKIDVNKLKQVAGCFPTGVAVVTYLDELKQVNGITINSFVSISLDPPLIMFSIQDNASFNSFCKKDIPLAFNLLSKEQEELSNYYAGFGKVELNPKISIEDQYALLDNTIAWYKTKISDIIPAGDHFLVLAKVVDLDLNTEKSPLVYFKGYTAL